MNLNIGIYFEKPNIGQNQASQKSEQKIPKDIL
jgi:hypothetical protein